MAEPDSWEEAVSDSVYPPPSSSAVAAAAAAAAALNPSARPFTLNPSVASFTPSSVRPPYHHHHHQPMPMPPQPYPSYGYPRPPYFQSPYMQQQPPPSAYNPSPIPVPMPAYAPAPVSTVSVPHVPAPVYAAPDSTPVPAPAEIPRSAPVPAPVPAQTEAPASGYGRVPEDSHMVEKEEDPVAVAMEDAETDHPAIPCVASNESYGVTDATDALSAVKINHAEPSQSEWQEVGNADEVVCKPIDFMEEELNHKEHLNAVFIGHVDAGKSTIGGQILYLTNMVDERTIQKYEREAKEKSRESWYMAYIMDTNEEERAKGKTVEVGRAHFETEKRRFTILDAPGHKNYVPNMISGASQADIGVLVISARKGEFETGFERGGQTREHCLLAKTLGVSKLLVVVNKMDDPSVQWSKERFDEIEKKMGPFLRSSGYNVKKDVSFLPISGLLGVNMKDRVSKSICPWWDGPCLFEALESVEAPPRDPSGPFRMPVIDKFKDMGTVVMGKIESGIVRRGDNLIIMPNKVSVKVITVYRDNDEVNAARPGENLRIRLSGIEEEDISSGFVLSSIQRPIRAVREFDAQLQILELLDHKAIFTAGYKAVLHIHAVVEECEIMELLKQIDPKTKKPMHKKVLFVKSGAVVVARIQVNDAICVEKFEDFPQLGRFTCRDEGKTIAIGKVVAFPRVTNQE